MRYFLLLLILVPLFSLAQNGEQHNRSNGSNTMNDPRLKASTNFYMPVMDSASLQGGLDSAGAIVYDQNTEKVMLYKGNGVWVPLGGNVPFFTSLAEFNSYVPFEREVGVLDNDVHGGGVFIAMPKDTFNVDNWRVFATGDTNFVWLRNIYKRNLIELEWFNIKQGYTGNIKPAIDSAISYLSTVGGGVVHIGPGRFFIDPSLSYYADNITVRGSGQDVTTIFPQTGHGNHAFQPNPGYRYVGWLINAVDLITYDDTKFAIGRGYIDVRVDTTAARFKEGTKIFINAGASHYDQNYGEFNIVDSVIGSRIYLKYNMNRDYTQNLSSWTSTLTSPFTPPAEGGTASLNFSGDAPQSFVSIGNDLYEVVSVTGNSATVRNIPNKGNQVGEFPVGTHIFKYRAIVLTPTTTYNSGLEDITVEGRRMAIMLSNSIKTYINRCKFVWLPEPNIGGSWWLDGDDGRDFVMENSEIHNTYYTKCQFARSFSDIRMTGNKFFNAALEFSEFNSNIEVTHNTFHLRYSGLGAETNWAGFLLGNTCNNIKIADNDIYASNLTYVFYSSEIQVFSATGSRNVFITGNSIACDNIGYVFANGGFAGINIEGNHITGKANMLFGSNAGEYLESDNRFSSSARFGFGSRCVINNNTFAGYVDGFGGPNANVEYTNNYVNRFGPANQSGEFNAWGNVMYRHFTLPDEAENFIFSNNTFKGWDLRANSIIFPFPLGKRTQVCNNRFFDMVGIYAAVGDSIVNIQCTGGSGGASNESIDSLNTVINKIKDSITLPNNWVALGKGSMGLKADSAFYYNPSNETFRLNSLTQDATITVKGQTSWSYLTNPGESFTLDDMSLRVMSVSNSNSVYIPKPVNAGFNKFIQIDQPASRISIHVGNVDATGAGFDRPNGSNFSRMRIFSGKTNDNFGTPRQGYIDFATGDAAGTLVNRVQIDSAGDLNLITGKLVVPTTVTAGGTTGDQTIDKASGKVNFAAGASTLVVTNSLVTTTSIVTVQVEGADATATSARVTLAGGSFTITLNAAATAETRVSFTVINN